MADPVRIISRPTPPTELERDLEESIKLVELVRAGAVFVRPERLPSELQLLAAQARISSICRGARYWLTDKGMAASEGWRVG